jgi:hypothetical protein
MLALTARRSIGTFGTACHPSRGGRKIAAERRLKRCQQRGSRDDTVRRKELEMKSYFSRVFACAVFALLVHFAGSLSAIETTYGEDPVPDTYRSLSPPFTAYGMDPIPVKSPLERWLMFKNQRDRKIEEREAYRQSDPQRAKRIWRLW